MEPAQSSLRSLLQLTGSQTHFSEDEDFGVAEKTENWVGKNNNFFVQKRIFSLEYKEGFNVQENLLKLSTKKLGLTLYKYMNERRSESLSWRLEAAKQQPSRAIGKLKSHSLETHNDDEYYYSKKYQNLLRQTKRLVFAYHK